jgi:hypothetical protein
MMTKIFIYFALVSSILFLPESIWEKFWSLSERFLSFIRSFKKKDPGENLLEFFPGLEAKLAMGMKTTTFQIPQYKFYTGLLLELLGFHQKRGISLKQILPELRGNLTKDLQFEKKLKGSILGGNLQFLVIFMTTWGFIFLSSLMADLPLKISSLFIIFTFQTTGLLVFNLFLKRIKNKIFLKFDQAIERLYLFVSLVEVGLPVGQVLAESKVLEGDLVKHQAFSPCASRLMTLVNRWKENGISPKTEAAEIIRDLWHLKESSFERFLKHLDLLKFTVLAFFFLPAYFFHLYSIFQFFMEQ